MLKTMRIVSLALFLIVTGGVVAGVFADTEVKDVLGVIHVSGKYYFSTNDFLNEGADEIEALGTSVIKLWLNRFPANNYVWNSDWSQYSFANMVDLIQTPYYQNVINREQFETIVFVATEFRVGGYAGINWQDTVSSSEYQNCQQDFYNLTKYLLTNYVDSGKTFILQNWEGDNSLNFDVITNATDRADRTAGMISWLNARQDGIDQARDEVGMTNGVMVFGAAEVNQIPVAGKTFSWPTAIDTVVPYVEMDLYSYSDWATKSAGTETNLPVILDYIKDKAPSSYYFDDDNIYLGEFGCYEMKSLGYLVDAHTDESDRVHREIVGKQLELALKWGVNYALYWEVFCNGLRNGAAPSGEADESELVGVWLRRPDGSYTGAYKYFENILPKNIDDYASIYEVENQTVLVSSGDSHSEFESADLSGRYGSKLAASGVDDFIQYSLFVPSPGTYTVSVRHKKASDRGTFQLALNGVNLGAAMDAYSAVSGYVTVELGTVNITTAGEKNFKFTVAGKNAASSDYDLALDYIQLSQTAVYEAESEITTVSSGDSSTVFSGTELSGGYGSKLNANAVDDFIQYKVYVAEPGAYTVTVRYKSSTARGIFQPLIEGYTFGSTVDCYAAVSGYVTVNLGTVNVSRAGYKRFKFKVIGKNTSSSDYDLAFDYLDLTLN